MVAELGSAGNDGDLKVKQRALNEIMGRLISDPRIKMPLTC